MAAALREVRARIERACAAAGRSPADVAVLAVTKGFGPEAIVSAIRAGLADVGENYYQEAAAKFARLAPDQRPPRAHFIGRLQRNKARKIGALFDVVQTADDEAALDGLDRGALDSGKQLDVCVQVNVSGDRRAGVAPEDCDRLAAAVAERPHLRVAGVMAIGPHDERRTAEAFALARRAFTSVRAAHPGATLLSLGMSGDLEAAVAAGATMVRIGTGLFGARPLVKD